MYLFMYMNVCSLPCWILVAKGENMGCSFCHTSFHIRYYKMQPSFRLIQWEFNVHLHNFHLCTQTPGQTIITDIILCLKNEKKKSPFLEALLRDIVSTSDVKSFDTLIANDNTLIFASSIENDGTLSGNTGSRWCVSDFDSNNHILSTINKKSPNYIFVFFNNQLHSNACYNMKERICHSVHFIGFIQLLKPSYYKRQTWKLQFPSSFIPCDLLTISLFPELWRNFNGKLPIPSIWIHSTNRCRVSTGEIVQVPPVNHSDTEKKYAPRWRQEHTWRPLYYYQ